MPPPSLEMLLTTLATEAMIALGQVPHPATGQQEIQLDQAKYFVDTIAMLREKTAGNLTADETTAVEGLLHQLRTAYLVALQVAATAAGPPPPTPT
ncbi:MAG: hypothetical protein A2W31_18325 [Planctomycetes bacterium RBG_16_64_10]|nr:MAG: hypothetical protein A2W31_18325 [Planctomycetes bacterium RBG_16_64_10]